MDAIDNLIKNNPALADDILEAFNSIADETKIDPVTERDWALTHPSQLKCGSDRYYSTLANKIQKDFAQIDFPPNLPPDVIRETAMTLTAYLEDLISGLGVWKSIKSLYKKQYGDWLPFFDCSHDDYLEDDLNIEDIKFLVWQTWCRCGQRIKSTYSPLSQAVARMAEDAFDILVDHFDEAPRCGRVADRLENIFRKGDLYELRTLGVWLGVDNKLTAVPQMRLSIMENAQSILQKNHLDLTERMAYYYCEASEGWKNAISMLGCPTHVLLAQMAEQSGNDKSANLLKNLRVLPKDVYSVTNIGDRTLVIENILGKDYILDLTSLAPGSDVTGVRTFVGSIVKFGEFWQQNGMGVFSKEPLKNDGNTRRMEEIPDEIRERLQQIVKGKRGRRVFYCKDTAQMSELIGVLQAIPITTDGEDAIEPENFVVMISDSTAPLIFPDICGIFSDRINPFYNPRADREWMAEESLRLIMMGNLPDDVAAYIQEKHILPHAEINAVQGKRVGKSIVQDNLRFLFGFYRVNVPDLDSFDLED